MVEKKKRAVCAPCAKIKKVGEIYGRNEKNMTFFWQKKFEKGGSFWDMEMWGDGRVPDLILLLPCPFAE